MESWKHRPRCSHIIHSICEFTVLYQVKFICVDVCVCAASLALGAEAVSMYVCSFTTAVSILPPLLHNMSNELHGKRKPLSIIAEAHVSKLVANCYRPPAEIPRAENNVNNIDLVKRFSCNIGSLLECPSSFENVIISFGLPACV